jgi:hypothetical protein
MSAVDAGTVVAQTGHVRLTARPNAVHDIERLPEVTRCDTLCEAACGIT